MTDLNDQMYETANYAVRLAKEKFGQGLDFSDQSIDKLENILGQAYQSLSNLPKDEKTGDLISQTANIWGSYLGEFMCLKWDGTWTMKGSKRFVLINNIELSPIGFVYQKITVNPEYRVEKYLNEAEVKMPA